MVPTKSSAVAVPAVACSIVVVADDSESVEARVLVKDGKMLPASMLSAGEMDRMEGKVGHSQVGVHEMRNEMGPMSMVKGDGCPPAGPLVLYNACWSHLEAVRMDTLTVGVGCQENSDPVYGSMPRGANMKDVLCTEMAVGRCVSAACVDCGCHWGSDSKVGDMAMAWVKPCSTGLSVVLVWQCLSDALVVANVFALEGAVSLRVKCDPTGTHAKMLDLVVYGGVQRACPCNCVAQLGVVVAMSSDGVVELSCHSHSSSLLSHMKGFDSVMAVAIHVDGMVDMSVTMKGCESVDRLYMSNGDVRQMAPLVNGENGMCYPTSVCAASDEWKVFAKTVSVMVENSNSLSHGVMSMSVDRKFAWVENAIPCSGGERCSLDTLGCDTAVGLVSDSLGQTDPVLRGMHGWAAQWDGCSRPEKCFDCLSCPPGNYLLSQRARDRELDVDCHREQTWCAGRNVTCSLTYCSGRDRRDECVDRSWWYLYVDGPPCDDCTDNPSCPAVVPNCYGTHPSTGLGGGLQETEVTTVGDVELSEHHCQPMTCSSNRCNFHMGNSAKDELRSSGREPVNEQSAQYAQYTAVEAFNFDVFCLLPYLAQVKHVVCACMSAKLCREVPSKKKHGDGRVWYVVHLRCHMEKMLNVSDPQSPLQESTEVQTCPHCGATKEVGRDWLMTRGNHDKTSCMIEMCAKMGTVIEANNHYLPSVDDGYGLQALLVIDGTVVPCDTVGVVTLGQFAAAIEHNDRQYNCHRYETGSVVGVTVVSQGRDVPPSYNLMASIDGSIVLLLPNTNDGSATVNYPLTCVLMPSVVRSHGCGDVVILLYMAMSDHMKVPTGMSLLMSHFDLQQSCVATSRGACADRLEHGVMFGHRVDSLPFGPGNDMVGIHEPSSVQVSDLKVCMVASEVTAVWTCVVGASGFVNCMDAWWGAHELDMGESSAELVSLCTCAVMWCSEVALSLVNGVHWAGRSETACMKNNVMPVVAVADGWLSVVLGWTAAATDGESGTDGVAKMFDSAWPAGHWMKEGCVCTQGCKTGCVNAVQACSCNVWGGCPISHLSLANGSCCVLVEAMCVGDVSVPMSDMIEVVSLDGSMLPPESAVEDGLRTETGQWKGANGKELGTGETYAGCRYGSPGSGPVVRGVPTVLAVLQDGMWHVRGGMRDVNRTQGVSLVDGGTVCSDALNQGCLVYSIRKTDADWMGTWSGGPDPGRAGAVAEGPGDTMHAGDNLPTCTDHSCMFRNLGESDDALKRHFEYVDVLNNSHRHCMRYHCSLTCGMGGNWSVSRGVGETRTDKLALDPVEAETCNASTVMNLVLDPVPMVRDMMSVGEAPHRLSVGGDALVGPVIGYVSIVGVGVLSAACNMIRILVMSVSGMSWCGSKGMPMTQVQMGMSGGMEKAMSIGVVFAQDGGSAELRTAGCDGSGQVYPSVHDVVDGPKSPVLMMDDSVMVGEADTACALVNAMSLESKKTCGSSTEGGVMSMSVDGAMSMAGGEVGCVVVATANVIMVCIHMLSVGQGGVSDPGVLEGPSRSLVYRMLMVDDACMDACSRMQTWGLVGAMSVGVWVVADYSHSFLAHVVLDPNPRCRMGGMVTVNAHPCVIALKYVMAKENFPMDRGESHAAGGEMAGGGVSWSNIVLVDVGGKARLNDSLSLGGGPQGWKNVLDWVNMDDMNGLTAQDGGGGCQCTSGCAMSAGDVCAAVGDGLIVGPEPVQLTAGMGLSLARQIQVQMPPDVANMPCGKIAQAGMGVGASLSCGVGMPGDGLVESEGISQPVDQLVLHAAMNQAMVGGNSESACVNAQSVGRMLAVGMVWAHGVMDSASGEDAVPGVSYVGLMSVSVGVMFDVRSASVGDGDLYSDMAMVGVSLAAKRGVGMSMAYVVDGGCMVLVMVLVTDAAGGMSRPESDTPRSLGSAHRSDVLDVLMPEIDLMMGNATKRCLKNGNGHPPVVLYHMDEMASGPHKGHGVQMGAYWANGSNASMPKLGNDLCNGSAGLWFALQWMAPAANALCSMKVDQSSPGMMVDHLPCLEVLDWRCASMQWMNHELSGGLHANGVRMMMGVPVLGELQTAIACYLADACVNNSLEEVDDLLAHRGCDHECTQSGPQHEDACMVGVPDGDTVEAPVPDMTSMDDECKMAENHSVKKRGAGAESYVVAVVCGWQAADLVMVTCSGDGVASDSNGYDQMTGVSLGCGWTANGVGGVVFASMAMGLRDPDGAVEGAMSCPVGGVWSGVPGGGALMNGSSHWSDVVWLEMSSVDVNGRAINRVSCSVGGAVPDRKSDHVIVLWMCGLSPQVLRMVPGGCFGAPPDGVVQSWVMVLMLMKMSPAARNRLDVAENMLWLRLLFVGGGHTCKPVLQQHGDNAGSAQRMCHGDCAMTDGALKARGEKDVTKGDLSDQRVALVGGMPSHGVCSDVCCVAVGMGVDASNDPGKGGHMPGETSVHDCSSLDDERCLAEVHSVKKRSGEGGTLLESDDARAKGGTETVAGVDGMACLAAADGMSDVVDVMSKAANVVVAFKGAWQDSAAVDGTWCGPVCALLDWEDSPETASKGSVHTGCLSLGSHSTPCQERKRLTKMASRSASSLAVGMVLSFRTGAVWVDEFVVRCLVVWPAMVLRRMCWSVEMWGCTSKDKGVRHDSASAGDLTIYCRENRENGVVAHFVSSGKHKASNSGSGGDGMQNATRCPENNGESDDHMVKAPVATTGANNGVLDFEGSAWGAEKTAGTTWVKYLELKTASQVTSFYGKNLCVYAYRMKANLTSRIHVEKNGPVRSDTGVCPSGGDGETKLGSTTLDKSYFAWLGHETRSDVSGFSADWSSEWQGVGRYVE